MLALLPELAKLLELGPGDNRARHRLQGRHPGLRAAEAFSPRAYRGDYRAFEPTLLPKHAKLLELGPDAYEGDNKAHRL